MGTMYSDSKETEVRNENDSYTQVKRKKYRDFLYRFNNELHFEATDDRQSCRKRTKC